MAACQRLARLLRQLVDLIEDQELRRFDPDVVQDAAYGLDATLAVRRRGVHDMQQERGVGQLFEGRAERGDQIGRQIPDEADRVGDDDLALAREPQTARDRVQGGELLIGDVLLPALV